MSTDIFIQNRPFFSRVRAAAYVRARERLHQVIAMFPSDGHLDREFLRAVEAFVVELEAAHEYAMDAVRGLNRLRVQRFRHDRSNGILEEELVLLHFLEERVTHARFLRIRVETDLKSAVMAIVFVVSKSNVPREERHYRAFWTHWVD